MHAAQAIAKRDRRTDKWVSMWLFSSLSHKIVQALVPIPVFSLFKHKFQHHKPVTLYNH